MLSELIGDIKGIKIDRDRHAISKLEATYSSFFHAQLTDVMMRRSPGASENERTNKLTCVVVHGCVRGCVDACMRACMCVYDVCRECVRVYMKQETERKEEKPRFNRNVGVYE